MPPSNMPLCHVDCYELKASKTQKNQENHFFYLLTALKQFRWRGGSVKERKRAVTRNTFFFNLKYLSAWQGKHLIVRHLFSSSCDFPPLLYSPSPSPFPLLRLTSKTQMFDCLWVSLFYGAPIGTKSNLFFSSESLLCQFNY